MIYRVYQAKKHRNHRDQDDKLFDMGQLLDKKGKASALMCKKSGLPSKRFM
jgi:hypothetical protein